jgi:CBS domain-containing protein
MKSAVAQSPRVARDLLAPVDPAVRPQTSLREALEILGSGVDSEAFVIDDAGRPLGSISTLDILDYAHARELPAWPNDGAPVEVVLNEASVISAMRPDVVTASPDTPVELMRGYMRRTRVRKLLVCEGSRILGQVAAESLDREG